MKKTVFLTFFCIVINFIFCAGCADSSAQTQYSANAKASTPDAAECAYTFEKEQNKKALEKARLHINSKPPVRERLSNVKEPKTKRVNYSNNAPRKNK